jgi:hypothetical protein
MKNHFFCDLCVLFVFRVYVVGSELQIKFALAYCAVRLLFIFTSWQGF